MPAKKAKKYPDYFVKAEKFKRKLKFDFFCNNLSIHTFQRSSIPSSLGQLTADFSHSYNGIKIRCTVTMPKKSLGRLLSGEALPNVTIYKNGDSFRFVFTVNYTDYQKHLNMRYAEIPEQVTIIKQTEDKNLKVKTDIEIIYDKKPYSVLIGYHDSSLPKTPKRERRALVFYNGLSQTPLRGGGFSPR